MKRILNFNIISILCLPILFFVAVKFLMTSLSGQSICLFKNLTGYECWGCGMTRAFNELFKLNFYEAYKFNPRIIIVAPLMLFGWLQILYRELKNNTHSIGELE